jgi:glucose-1-phosphate cytidylyltransferase
VKVAILCGGKGTRIRDVSSEIPKPMIPIGQFPIVKHIMDIYGRHGFEEFILCLGYKGWKIKEYFLNFRAETADITIDMAENGAVSYSDTDAMPSWKVTLAETGYEAMTGCRVKRIQKYVGDNTFMLTYGDGVGDVDVTKLVEFHKSHGKLITITSVRPAARFGELVVENDQVTSFQEKPQAAGGYINGGFFVCEPGVFDYVSEDESCTFEREPMQRLAQDGQMMTYRHDGFWMPMDTFREYKLLNDMWNSGEAPWLKGA